MDNLYLIHEGTMLPAKEFDYETESELQDIISKHPDLLSGDNDQVHGFALIQPEFTIPSLEGTGVSFFLDHLMVNDKGVLCLVEVKRSTDTRVRREVVAQMLDYASKMSSVDVGCLRDLFTMNNDDFAVLELFGTDEFWERVAMNIEAERMDLYFVADENPDSLLSILSFLGRQFSNIEIFSVEVKRYKSEQSMLLSSSLKSFRKPDKIRISSPSIPWDSATFRDKLLEIDHGRLEPVIFRLTEECKKEGYSLVYGKGAKFPTFRLLYGDVTVFKAELSGFGRLPKCCFEVNLPCIQSDFSESKDINLRSLVSSFPQTTLPCDEKLLWHTDKYFYLNAILLSDDLNFAYFLDVAKKIKLLLEESI